MKTYKRKRKYYLKMDVIKRNITIIFLILAFIGLTKTIIKQVEKEKAYKNSFYYVEDQKEEKTKEDEIKEILKELEK